MKHKFLVVVGVAALVVATLLSNSTARASGNMGPVGPLVWNVQYFNNASLSGNPVVTGQAYAVGADWGNGSPGFGLATDYFSIRWTTTANLAGGTYRFTLLADDGVRLVIDGKTYLDTFGEPRPGQTLGTQLTLNRGNHTVQLDYRENTSTAFLYFTWEEVSVTTPTPAPVLVSSGPAVGLVNTSGLNVHAGPGYSYDIVIVAFKDWAMSLLGRNRQSDWLKVQTHDGKVGWVESSHLSTTYPITNLPVVDGTQQPSTNPSRPRTSPPVGQQRVHTVQRGETLSQIARRYGTNMLTLARINGIANVNLIYAGQVLRIP